jgi:hypothetical protein
MGENDVKDFFSAGCNILNNRLQLKGNKWMSSHSINFTVQLQWSRRDDVSLRNMSLNSVTFDSYAMYFFLKVWCLDATLYDLLYFYRKNDDSSKNIRDTSFRNDSSRHL